MLAESGCARTIDGVSVVRHGVRVDMANRSLRCSRRLVSCVGETGLSPRRIASGPHDPIPNRTCLLDDKSISAVSADKHAKHRTGGIPRPSNVATARLWCGQSDLPCHAHHGRDRIAKRGNEWRFRCLTNAPGSGRRISGQAAHGPLSTDDKITLQWRAAYSFPRLVGGAR
jgi:hypothetical protein